MGHAKKSAYNFVASRRFCAAAVRGVNPAPLFGCGVNLGGTTGSGNGRALSGMGMSVLYRGTPASGEQLRREV